MLTPSLAAGGAERQLVLTARGLATRGWTVEVAAKHLEIPAGCDALRGDLGAIPVFAVAAKDTAPAGRALADGGLQALPPDFFALLADLHALILDRRPTVVHAWMDEMAAAGGLAAAMAGVPRIVLAGRNLAPHHFGVPQLGAIAGVMRALADDPRVVLVNNSRAGAADYARWLDVQEHRIGVVRNGFVPIADGDRSAWRRRLGIPAEAPVIGGLFRLAPEKRPLLWMEVAARVLDRISDAHFVIFGDGPLRPTMEQRAERLRLRGRIHLPGVTSEREDAFAAFDLFLLTSVHEGTPNVVLECQWLGLPMVVTGAGGVVEAVAEPELIDDHPDTLAEAVVARLGRASVRRHDWIERRFGLARMIDETETLFGGSVAS